MNTVIQKFFWGIIGSIVICLFGGFSLPLKVLFICMIIDYITGILAAIYVRKNLSSKIGFKGGIKKIVMLLICSLAYYIDNLTNAHGLIANGALIYYCATEGISIVENADDLGIPIPKRLKAALQSLKEEDDEGKIL